MKGRVFIFFGLIASGKSTLATAWARRLGCPCFNSDRVRKELAGVAAESRQAAPMGEGIYNHDFSRLTYDRLSELATEALCQERSQGRGCVALDASYSSRAERDRIRERLAPVAEVIFVHCLCPEEEMRERMERRQQDAQAVSDGRWEIYLQQKDIFEDPVELGPGQLITINTQKPLAELLRDLEGVAEGPAETVVPGSRPI